MKRQLFIILLLGTSVCLSWGQNGPKKYYEYINKAELAYLEVSDNNDFGQKAARCYEKAFAANRPFSKDLRQYLLLYSYNKQGRLDIALECAHILAQRGMLWPKWYDADTAFQRTLYLIKDTTRIITDPELVAALDSLRTRDRNFRNSVSRWDDEIYQAAAALDSANMQSLVELFWQYGYINEDNAGELYASTIELVFIHNSKTRDAELPFDIAESIGVRTIGVHISFDQLAEAPLPSSRCSTTLYPPNLLLPSYWIFPCLRSSAMQRSMVRTLVSEGN